MAERGHPDHSQEDRKSLFRVDPNASVEELTAQFQRSEELLKSHAQIPDIPLSLLPLLLEIHLKALEEYRESVHETSITPHSSGTVL